MKLSHKLDMLQALSQEHAEEPYQLYLIELLAEHIEEAEMTTEFLEWAVNAIRVFS